MLLNIYFEDLFTSAAWANSRYGPCSGHAHQLTDLVRVSASVGCYGAPLLEVQKMLMVPNTKEKKRNLKSPRNILPFARICSNMHTNIFHRTVKNNDIGRNWKGRDKAKMLSEEPELFQQR